MGIIDKNYVIFSPYRNKELYTWINTIDILKNWHKILFIWLKMKMFVIASFYKMKLTCFCNKGIPVKLQTYEHKFTINRGNKEIISTFNTNVQKRQSTIILHFHCKLQGWMKGIKLSMAIASLMESKIENVSTT